MKLKTVTTGSHQSQPEGNFLKNGDNFDVLLSQVALANFQLFLRTILETMNFLRKQPNFFGLKILAHYTRLLKCSTS